MRRPVLSNCATANGGGVTSIFSPRRPEDESDASRMKTPQQGKCITIRMRILPTFRCGRGVAMPNAICDDGRE